MRDLNRFVVPKIQAHWRDVGYALRYGVSTIKGIESKHNSDPKNCCRELFEDWLTTDNGKKAGPKTWSTLLRALGEVDELAAAKQQIVKDLQ